MAYTVLVLRRAQRELSALPTEAYPRVRDAMRSLADDPRPANCLKLKSGAGWRLRVGRFRVIYEIDDSEQTVTIVHVGHRDDVYR